MAHPFVDGRRLRIALAFEATRPVTEPLTVVAQVFDRASPPRVVGQVDHTFGAARWNDPRGLVDQMDIPAFRGAAGGEAEVRVGVYRVTARGPGAGAVAIAGGERDAVVIGRVSLRVPDDPRDLPTQPGIPFDSAMSLVAHDVRREDGEIVVDLTWRAERAYESDYTVSVQVHGEGWDAQDDGTPALGAIPTLKWLRGMVVHDRHRVPLPAGVPPDAPFRVTVGVYDAFSLEPLAVTDGERVRRGEGQAVEVDGGR